MSACEICWAEASRKAFISGRLTAELYHAELDAHPEHGDVNPSVDENPL